MDNDVDIDELLAKTANIKKRNATVDDFFEFMEKVGHKAIHPDHLYEEQSMTFTYNEDGLRYGEYPTKHSEILEKLGLDRDRTKHTALTVGVDSVKFSIGAILLGRISSHHYFTEEWRLEDLCQEWNEWAMDRDLIVYPSTLKNTRLVAFWNYKSDLVKNLLPKCCQALLRAKLASENDIATSFEGKVQYIDGHRPSTEQKNQNVSQDFAKKIEMWKNLHLMRGNKKQAMADLGLSAKSSKHSWQDAMEKGGYISPGQKWWTQSESFRQWLEIE